MYNEIFYCAIGALILALAIVWASVRANRRQDFRSAADARRRIGIEDCVVRVDRADGIQVREKQVPSLVESARRIEYAKQAVREQGQRDARRAPDVSVPMQLVVNRKLAEDARRWGAPSPTPAPDSYLDNPILNPIHPLHSAFTAPAETHHHSAPSPSPSYDCPSPPPSYDSGSSSSSCDSSSSSSDWN